MDRPNRGAHGLLFGAPGRAGLGSADYGLMMLPRTLAIALASTSLVAVGLAAGVHASAPSAPDDAPAVSTTAAVSTRGAAPFAELPEPPLPEELAFAGVVREARGAGAYVYLLVADDLGGQRWVATHARIGAEPGAAVDVRTFAVRTDFRSPRLDRTFDRLLFGIVTRRDSSE